jgi:3-deoxy-D-manno-octulosonate 8-phosphate phosphatase (KDO 8-P phosphatase)
LKPGVRLAAVELERRLKDVTVLALDCDGVMTQNELIYDKDGDDQHVFFARDSNGLMMLRRFANVRLACISGRQSQSVDRRMRELRFEHILQRAYQKGKALKELAAEQHYPMHEICYIGDDLNDIGAIHLAGVGIATHDAVPELRERADFVTIHHGGRGAVREVCEMILKAKGLWQGIVEAFDQDV